VVPFRRPGRGIGDGLVQYLVPDLPSARIPCHPGDDDIVQHRRWMIRVFAIGVSVGTMRIWTALFIFTGLLDFPAAISRAFWISFTLHALVAEHYLRARPLPPE
jgi:hypothetical protein